MPNLQSDVLTTHSGLIAVVAVGIAVLALVVAMVAQRRMARIRSSLRVLRGAAPDGDILEMADRYIREMRSLRDQVESQRAQLESAHRNLGSSLRHKAMVRFDAFGDTGGRTSFTVALLDDAGDGLLLTSINGRGETRTYGKTVTGRRSDVTLTPEEEQALAAAQ